MPFTPKHCLCPSFYSNNKCSPVAMLGRPRLGSLRGDQRRTSPGACPPVVHSWVAGKLRNNSNIREERRGAIRGTDKVLWKFRGKGDFSQLHPNHILPRISCIVVLSGYWFPCCWTAANQSHWIINSQGRSFLCLQTVSSSETGLENSDRHIEGARVYVVKNAAPQERTSIRCYLNVQYMLVDIGLY